MNKVITTLEADVDESQWGTLQEAYRTLKSQQLPASLVESFLAQDTKEPSRWRLISVWISKSGLQEYAESVDTPEGMLVFREAGVEPSLTIHEAKEEIQPE